MMEQVLLSEESKLLCEDTVRKQLFVSHDQYANLTQRWSPSREYGSHAVRIASVTSGSQVMVPTYGNLSWWEAEHESQHPITNTLWIYFCQVPWQNLQFKLISLWFLSWHSFNNVNVPFRKRCTEGTLSMLSLFPQTMWPAGQYMKIKVTMEYPLNRLVLMVHNGGQFNPGFEGREWEIASVPSKA